MSKLILSDSDIKQAVVQYYEDHQTELYERYDFENIEVAYVFNHNNALPEFDDVMGHNSNPIELSIEVEERKS